METIKIFRKRNKISQVALAEYLNVTQGFISQMENGTSAIPDTIISKILANEFNWDVSMLVESEDTVEEKPGIMAECRPALSNIELLLWNQLAEKDAKIDALNEIIWELKEEIGRLKAELASTHKGGDVQNADSSSSADAV